MNRSVPPGKPGASGGVNLGRIVHHGWRSGAARARNRDQHEGRHLIAKALHGRAQIITAVAVAIIPILARRFAVPGRLITHGGFTQRKFARLRIAVPARGTIPARSLSALRRFRARAAFRAVTPSGGFGGDFFRRFGARRAV
jgi:hypothetical protein